MARPSTTWLSFLTTHPASRTCRPAQRRAAICGLLAGVVAAGCSKAGTIGFDIDFAQGPSGWSAGFADYPEADTAIYALEARYQPLPPPLDGSRSALFIAGTNRSDDLWMYFRAPGRLEPNSFYRVTFQVEIATQVPSGCGGVGGAPGEGVTLKAGVSLVEPRPMLEAGWWRMNVDKGQQSSGGSDALAIGNLANSRDCEDGFGWELKSLSSGSDFLPIVTDASGSVWLFVGSDSGFESRSAFYITRYVALFERG